MSTPLVSLLFFSTLINFSAFGEASRAFFVFGDSLVDNGNNNYLLTTARADVPPYGIDYLTHRPTGRFSNGKNIADIISENLGAESVLPYLSPELQGDKLLVGANFASAGVGILNDTGVQFLNIIRIARQFEYFEQYQQRLSSLIGPQQAQKIVNNALVLFTLGGNDFVNNYYLLPNSARSQQYELPDYVRFVISEYKKILRRLYNLGGRRVLVTGTGPIGCVPAELALRSRDGSCDPELTKAAGLFNPQLTQIVNELNKETGSQAFISANSFQSHLDFINNPQAYGFATSKDACCGQGAYNGLGLCTALSNLCDHRDEYVWWDGFHPTERANRLIVSKFMTGSTKYMHPLNLSTVLFLDATA